jgi:CheY-like chemotaxis protein
VKVSITDAGPGIPQHLLGRIFDPFFSTKPRGSGLGMAICHSILRQHEGFITVESPPGRGATFHFFLPASQRKEAVPDASAASVHQGRGRILVMDDEDFIRETVGEMLGSMGYDVVLARDGQEALRRCLEAQTVGDPFCAALFDLTIPGRLGGREAVAELRRQQITFPVFASSGYSEDPAMATPWEHGFTDSIRKPFRMAELAELLNRSLKNRG